ncbi:BLOC-1-related complex subunit 6 isoform 1-T4 [Spinachia spinachia]
MSLSPVIGTDVPEGANGVLTPVSSEKRAHVSISVKCAGSREPRPGEASEDTENHVHAGNRVHHGESHRDTEKFNNGRTSTSFTQHTPRVTDASLPAASRTGRTEDWESGSKDTDICEACHNVEPPDAALLWDPAQQAHSKESSQGRGPADSRDEAEDDEKAKQDDEGDEKKEKKWINQRAGGRTQAESSRHYSSSAPGPSTSSTSSPPPSLLPSDDITCPPHVMAQVWVRNVRGMQDSKSLDEISQAFGGGSGNRVGGRGGQSEGRRATISSALELEGTVSQDGDLTHFITKNLEQKIKMSSKPSLDCSDSDCSGPIYRSRGLSRRRADIPPIDPAVLLDLQRHAQEVAHSVEMMMRSLNGTIQNMTALSVGYIQTYRDSVDSLGESVDMSIKGMYTLMARCEELDRSMQPIHTLSAQIRDIKRTLDALEAICK